MLRSFISRLDRFLPEKLAAENVAIDMLTRARVQTAMLLISLGIVGVLFFVFLFLQLAGISDFVGALLALGPAMFLLVTQCLFFYSVARIEISGIVFSATFFLCALLAVIFTGGWVSPVMQLFFCAPIISFLLAGRQEGFYTSALVVIGGFGLMWVDQTGFEFKQVMRPENHYYAEAAIWVITSFLLISSLAIYDMMLEELGRKQRRRN
ncbi:MAG: hypothetical protein KDI30_07385 [Pseudomonadales bacterium]|nr:hypothetical protein [Pseudomonadales bacterium]